MANQDGFWSQIGTGIQSGIEQFGQNLSQIASPISTPAQNTQQVPGQLAQLHQLVQGNPISSGSNRTKSVKLVQGSLKSLGYDINVDGKFGPNTKSAVINFQKKNNLPQTGMVDSATAAKLHEKIEAQKRRGQIIPSLANLAGQWGMSKLMDEYPQIPNGSGRGQTTTPTITPAETQGINWTPILIGGGALVGIILLTQIIK